MRINYRPVWKCNTDWHGGYADQVIVSRQLRYGGILVHEKEAAFCVQQDGTCHHRHQKEYHCACAHDVKVTWITSKLGNVNNCVHFSMFGKVNYILRSFLTIMQIPHGGLYLHVYCNVTYSLKKTLYLTFNHLQGSVNLRFNGSLNHFYTTFKV